MSKENHIKCLNKNHIECLKETTSNDYKTKFRKLLIRIKLHNYILLRSKLKGLFVCRASVEKHKIPVT